MCFKAKEFDIDLPVNPPNGNAVSGAGKKKRSKASPKPTKETRTAIKVNPPNVISPTNDGTQRPKSAKPIKAWFKRVKASIRGPSSKDQKAMKEKIDKLQIDVVYPTHERQAVIDIRSPLQEESSLYPTPVVAQESPESNSSSHFDTLSDTPSELDSPSIYSCESGSSSDFPQASPSPEYVTAESSPMEDQVDAQVSSISMDALIDLENAFHGSAFSDSSSDSSANSSASMASLSDFQTESAVEVDAVDASEVQVKGESATEEADYEFLSECEGPTIRLVASEPDIVELVSRATGLEVNVCKSSFGVDKAFADDKSVRFSPYDFVAVIPREPPMHELSFIVPSLEEGPQFYPPPSPVEQDVSSTLRTLLKPSSLYDPNACPSPVIAQSRKSQPDRGSLALPISSAFNSERFNASTFPTATTGRTAFGAAVVDDDLITVKRKAQAVDFNPSTPPQTPLPQVVQRSRDLPMPDEHAKMVLRRASAAIMEKRRESDLDSINEPFAIPSSPVERREGERLPTIHFLRHPAHDCPCLKKIARRRQRGPTLFRPSDLSNWDIIERAEPEEDIQQPRLSKESSQVPDEHISASRKYETENALASINSNLVSISSAAEVDPLVSGASVSLESVSHASVSASGLGLDIFTSGSVSFSCLSSPDESVSTSRLSTLDNSRTVASVHDLASFSASSRASTSQIISSKKVNRTAKIIQPVDVLNGDLDDFGVPSTRVPPQAISRKANRSARIFGTTSGLGAAADDASIDAYVRTSRKSLQEALAVLEQRSDNVMPPRSRGPSVASPLVSSVSAPEFSSNTSQGLASSDASDLRARRDLKSSRRAAVYMPFNSPTPAEPQSPVPALPPHLLFQKPILRLS